jgi:hypothetical protein
MTCVSKLRTSLKILLVREHQQERILHFSILNNPCEFRSCLVDTVAVVGVDNEDKALGSWSTVSTPALVFRIYRDWVVG